MAGPGGIGPHGAMYAILVLSGGAIAEQGSHDTLLARGGIYKELYETQFRKVLDMETEVDAGDRVGAYAYASLEMPE